MMQDGFDMSRAGDVDYANSFCPALASMNTPEAVAKVCTTGAASFLVKRVNMAVIATNSALPEPAVLSATETCHLEADDPDTGIHYSCDIPGEKVSCCDAAKALVKCGQDDQVCQTEKLTPLVPEMMQDGFDMSRAGDVDYANSFCPALASMNTPEAVAKVCTTGAASFLVKRVNMAAIAPNSAPPTQMSTPWAIASFVGALMFVAGFAVGAGRFRQVDASNYNALDGTA